MKKYLIALASTVLIASAYAQAPVASTSAATVKAADKSDAKRDANNEKHIKELHAKLKITAGEETLWAPVAETMRTNTVEIDKVVDKREAIIASATAIDDLNAYADIAQAHADSVKKLSLVFAPLYAAMPDAQKKIADEVFTQRGHGDKQISSAK
jgi:protein CpxP